MEAIIWKKSNWNDACLEAGNDNQRQIRMAAPAGRKNIAVVSGSLENTCGKGEIGRQFHFGRDGKTNSTGIPWIRQDDVFQKEVMNTKLSEYVRTKAEEIPVRNNKGSLEQRREREAQLGEQTQKGKCSPNIIGYAQVRLLLAFQPCICYLPPVNGALGPQIFNCHAAFSLFI